MLTRMARLPLNTLPAFRTVAQLSNLRAAAHALHLTHSAVSQQIRGLEDHLGFLLFDRRGRRVVLNAAGLALLRSVQGALAQLDDGVQAAAAAASGAAQRLRITVLPSFAQRWLLPRIGRWRDEYHRWTLATQQRGKFVCRWSKHHQRINLGSLANYGADQHHPGRGHLLGVQSWPRD